MSALSDAERLRRATDAMARAQRLLDTTLHELHEQVGASMPHWSPEARDSFEQARAEARDADAEMSVLLESLRTLLDDLSSTDASARPGNVRQLR